MQHEIKLFECDNGYYAVQIIGVTDFDKTEGEVADADSTSYQLIREYVAYYTQADLYNKYLLELTEDEKYALSEINRELMESLARKYLEDTGPLEE